MNEYKIVPWDHLVDETRSEADLEQFVPAEVEQLAYEVISHYDMSVSQMTLITSKPDKGGAIWKIETNHGPRSIKVLHRQPERSLFSVGAQEYLVKQGARVPALIATKSNELHVVAGGKMWIVTDWVTPLEQLMKIDLEGAAPLCRGLGEFHHHTKGYVPPQGAAKSSRIYRWEKHYEKMIKKIGWFRDLATAYSETAASALLLSVIDKFEAQANDIFEKFKQSPYRRMVNKGEVHWGLAHQDYGWSNGQMGPDGIWVIDLDGVSYDLPIRDLRKIITSTMDDMGVWDINWIRGVIDAYHQGNPIDQETFELLWLDMAFPNEFYKHVKEIVFDPTTFMNTELEPIINRILTTEANKWQVLEELALDKAKYAVGNYPEEVEETRVFSSIEPAFNVVPFSTDTAIPIYSELPVAPLYEEAQVIPFAEQSEADAVAAHENDAAIAKLIQEYENTPLPDVVSIPNNVIPFLADKVQRGTQRNTRSIKQQRSRRASNLRYRQQMRKSKSSKQVSALKKHKLVKAVTAVKKHKSINTVRLVKKHKSINSVRKVKVVKPAQVVQKARAQRAANLKKSTRIIREQQIQRKIPSLKRVQSYRKTKVWSASKKGVYYKKRLV